MSYPDGTWDGDPRAPWNEPDPWQGQECGTCRWLASLGGLHGCLWYACNEGEPIIPQRFPRDAACESWEHYLGAL